MNGERGEEVNLPLQSSEESDDALKAKQENGAGRCCLKGTIVSRIEFRRPERRGGTKGTGFPE